MVSKPKANSTITSRVPEGAEMVQVQVSIPAGMVFEVRDREGRIVREIAFDLQRVHPANLGRAVVHGWNQRIPDAAAIGLADKDGQIIPRAERERIKGERMEDLCRFYEEGGEEWSRKPTGTGGRSITIEAFARVKDLSYEEAVERVEAHAARMFGGDRKKALAQIAESPKVQQAMHEIRAERTPKANIDADKVVDQM